MPDAKQTCRSRWSKLETERSIYLRRGVECSSLTIPSLIPESDQTHGSSQLNTSLPSLYQGAGARGVSGLSAKLLLALFPPSQPFFKLQIDKAKMRSYAQKTGQKLEDLMSTLDVALSEIERIVLVKLDTLKARPAMSEALKHLIVSGNVLGYVSPDSIRVFPLRAYCIRRDPEGNPIEIVIREQVDPTVLDPRFRPEGGKEKIDVYTLVLIDKGKDRVDWHQEVDDKRLPDSSGFSRLDNSPWLPLRLHRIANESYGRGLVEEVIGDLQTLEKLSKAVVQGNLIGAKRLFLVNPNGTTRAVDLARAESGDVISGNINDVGVLGSDSTSDYSSALQTMQLIERRLNFTFLANESIQRNAERVTAEEIRLMAEQLEQGLGGVYSILSAELQLPLIKRVLYLLESVDGMPSIPEGLVNPIVTTGLEAIGRGNDKSRLTEFISTGLKIAQSLDEDTKQRLNMQELWTRLAASLGIEIAGLIRTEEELQSIQAKNQQLMLAQQLATQGASQVGPGTQQAQPPTPGGGSTGGAAGMQLDSSSGGPAG